MVCVIPARGGSKRLPGKNIKLIDRHPVIAYPIAAARESGLFERVYVSTNDDAIAAAAIHAGAGVLTRPEGLCADDAPDTEVIAYHMDRLKPDYMCYLYPTAALTTPEQLIRGLDTCRHTGGRVGCRVGYHNHHKTWIDGEWEAVDQFDAGQFYWIRGGDPIEDRGYIELDPMECQDVNTAEDWALLEAKWRVHD